MSKRNRNIIFAVIGLLVVAAIGGLGALTLRPIDLPKYQKFEGPEASYRAGGAGCDPSQLKRLSGRDSVDKRDSCKSAAEEYRLKRDDLVQQSRSADAAEALVGLTYRQTVLLLVGVILGLVTLGAAIYAAWYAKRAAEAAESDLTHTLHTARPYIATDKEEITYAADKKPQFAMSIVCRNAGNTPAHKLAFTAKIVFLYFNGGVVHCTNAQWNNGTTSPGTPVSLLANIELPDDEMRALCENKGHLIINLIGTYSNAFGEDWIYEHNLSVNHTSLTTGDIYTHDCKQYRATESKEEVKHQPRLPLKGGKGSKAAT